MLALRLNLDGNGGPHKAVINEGIGANTVTREGLTPAPYNTPGIERLDRDVLSQSGVTDLILFLGTNDVNRGGSAKQVIAGMENIIKRLKANGVRVFGATILPRHNAATLGGLQAWTDEKTKIVNEVDDWMRTKAPFDGVIDFHQFVRDPTNPNLFQSDLTCDGTHPSVRGYYEIGRSIPLDLLKGSARMPARP